MRSASFDGSPVLSTFMIVTLRVPQVSAFDAISASTYFTVACILPAFRPCNPPRLGCK